MLLCAVLKQMPSGSLSIHDVTALLAWATVCGVHNKIPNMYSTKGSVEFSFHDKFVKLPGSFWIALEYKCHTFLTCFIKFLEGLAAGLFSVPCSLHSIYYWHVPCPAERIGQCPRTVSFPLGNAAMRFCLLFLKTDSIPSILHVNWILVIDLGQ